MADYPMFMAGEHVGGGFTKSATPMSEVGILLHISVDDIDASLAKVKQSGGSTIQEKKQITPEIGWWAIFRDPAGNSIGLYQSARKS
jgi:predicted enzyme related to lactoylglutathione lyase